MEYKSIQGSVFHVSRARIADSSGLSFARFQQQAKNFCKLAPLSRHDSHICGEQIMIFTFYVHAVAGAGPASSSMERRDWRNLPMRGRWMTVLKRPMRSTPRSINLYVFF